MTISRRGRAKTAKKSTKKRYARAKLLFCTARFWCHSQLPSVRSCEQYHNYTCLAHTSPITRKACIEKALHLRNVTPRSVQRKSDQPQKVTTKFIIQNFRFIHGTSVCTMFAFKLLPGRPPLFFAQLSQMFYSQLLVFLNHNSLTRRSPRFLSCVNICKSGSS